MDELVAQLRAAGCVFAEEEADVLRSSASSAEQLQALAVRRMAGEPLEHLVGWAAFDGLRVRVAPGVFVPRLRTTLLVRVAAGLLAAGDVVVDLGCGSGAIGAAVAARVPGVEVWAVDIDPAAVACARLNLPPERVLLGDLLDPLPAGLAARVVCANAPYVPTGEIDLMPAEAREHEHRVALDGGADGLDVQRRVAAEVPARLVPGGSVLIETGRAQAPGTAALLEAAGLSVRLHVDDEVGGTVVEGRRTRKVAHPPPADDPRDGGTAR
jgi:release factor glutamine methyltransferase